MSLPELSFQSVPDFVRAFSLQPSNTMWFLGAGASVSAGLPTGWDILWDCKRSIFCTEQRIPIQQCRDLSDKNIRTQIQSYFDGQAGYPAQNSESEYSYYFEKAYPSAAQRRVYLQHLLACAKPSFGHYVLAALMRLGRVNMVWTTNFDRLVEDAAAQLYGTTGALHVASLTTPDIARQSVSQNQYPLLAKIHGDFQHERLKNTTAELQSQDADLRRTLLDTCTYNGLAVLGYSGRDDSIMSIFEEALERPNCFPAGISWFQYGTSLPFPRVARLLETAQSKGIAASLIPMPGFDELMADLLLLEDDMPSEIQAFLKRDNDYVSDAPVPPPGTELPAIRLNAIRVREYPHLCRLIRCDIGGTKEVRNALNAANADALAVRRNIGVIAFGPDPELRRAFANFKIDEFDVHKISVQDLSWESSELGLLYDAFGRALVRHRPVAAARHGARRFIAVDPSRDRGQLAGIKKCIKGALTGRICSGRIDWAEAVRFRLELIFDELWLVLHSTILLSKPRDESDRYAAAEFVRERLATRYNSHYNDLLAEWVRLLSGGPNEKSLSAFDTGDGLDARFELDAITAYSKFTTGTTR